MSSYLIWSHKHNAWWGPNRCGYVRDARDAGRYSRDEAVAITIDHVPHGGEVAVPEVSAMRHGTTYVWCGPAGETR